MFFDTKFINAAAKLDTLHILCCTIKGLIKTEMCMYPFSMQYFCLQF